MFSAAQLTVQAAIGWRCAGDLPFCLLLQTLALVAFNKASEGGDEGAAGSGWHCGQTKGEGEAAAAEAGDADTDECWHEWTPLPQVCTAQYFVWYLTFLPLVLPQLAVARNRVGRAGVGTAATPGCIPNALCTRHPPKTHSHIPHTCSRPSVQGRLLVAAAAWGCCMAHWLAWAYLLEFRGSPVHLGVWGAGLAFLAAHVWLLWELITAWRLGAGGEPPAEKRKLR